MNSYLLLVDSRIGEGKINELNDARSNSIKSTTVMQFSFATTSESSLLSQIAGNSYDRVGLIMPTTQQSTTVFQKQDNTVFQMLGTMDAAVLKEVERYDPELTSWRTFINFLRFLKQETHCTNFDFIISGIYSNDDWKYAIGELETLAGMTISAPSSSLGSANWYLEKGNLDLTTTYFNSAPVINQL